MLHLATAPRLRSPARLVPQSLVAFALPAAAGAPSTERGRICYADDCQGIDGTAADWAPNGYPTVPGIVCVAPPTDGGPNHVEPESWGRAKSRHRYVPFGPPLRGRKGGVRAVS